MRNQTLRAILVAASIGALPTALAAQQPARTDTLPDQHTVIKGETLWALAQQFLSDPFRWPEIYDLNKPLIANPHWIYPGQTFRLPGAVTMVTISVDTTGVAAVASADTVAVVDTTAQMDTTARPSTPVAPVEGQAQQFEMIGRSTAFTRRSPPPQALPGVGEETPPSFATVRMGEYVRAPYVIQAGASAAVGRVIKSGDLDPNGALEPTTMFQAYDNVLVSFPASATVNAGDRYVVATLGEALPGLGQVVVPTGVVQITRPPKGGASGVATVVQLFGEMNPDQVLVPLDTAGLSSTERPAPVDDGLWASIKWVLASPVLPTMQSYAVLDITTAQGVKPGDEFEVFRRRQSSDTYGAPDDPEVHVGRAQVIRVTPFGTTALITAQAQPAINVGMVARISAKMR
jgi:LysM domain